MGWVPLKNFKLQLPIYYIYMAVYLTADVGKWVWLHFTEWEIENWQLKFLLVRMFSTILSAKIEIVPNGRKFPFTMVENSKAQFLHFAPIL